MALPRTQVSITSMRELAIASGTHAPSKILMTLAAKNTCSMNSNGTTRAATCHTGQRQRLQKTKNAISEVVIMVAVTATPYAAARALELLKMATRSSTAISNSQLT